VTPGRSRLAVAVSSQYPDLRPDWPLLRRALTDLGLVVSTEVWTDPHVRWSDFDLVVANGAWDNIHHPAEFLAWADATALLAPMVNTPATLRWNLDKHYLVDLAAAGVATVPTLWLRAADEARSGLEDGAIGAAAAGAGALASIPRGDVVIKPTVSGGGFQTARYRAGEHREAQNHIGHLLAGGRDVMVQPYQEAVDAEGEGALIFLAGQFSHAVRKGPLLRRDIGPRSGLFEFEEISALEPTPAQLMTARAALAAAEARLGPTTYARVDLVPLDDGTPAVLELELLDPALFFEVHPQAATRFAHVLARLIKEAPTAQGG
jgi:glutathione synthase/RimK-type ligase-like ATP-grasp enzyme